MSLGALVRRHPRLVDVAVALLSVPAVLAPGARDGDVGGPGLVAALDGPALAMALAAGALLVLRRDVPWLVLAGTALLAVGSLLRVPDGAQATLPSLVALYTVATTARTRVVVGAALGLSVAIVLALLAAGLPIAQALQRSVVPWTVLAAVLGLTLQAHRRAVEVAGERARQAELTREEEAQRRVAEERLRIARDLHDVVAHQIAVVNVQAGLARHLLDGGSDEDTVAAAREALAHVRDATGQVMRELPAFLGVLRAESDAVDPTPTAARLEELVESVRRGGVEVRLRVGGTPDRLDQGAGVAAYRVLQEALTNVAKHGAGAAEVSVDHGPEATVIEVVNSLGPAAAVAPGTGGGHGLTGMRERVAAHGGTMRAGAGPDRRWRVHVEIPVRP